MPTESEVQQEPYDTAESRYFLPGNCSLDPQVRGSFLSGDHEAAKIACQSCIQLKYCSDQRDEVAQAVFLHSPARTSIVVAGEVVELEEFDPGLPHMSERQKISLVRPPFEFLPHKLETNEANIALQALRQALLDGLIDVRGSPSVKAKRMGEAFVEALKSEDDEDDFDKDITQLAHIVVQYSKVSDDEALMSRDDFLEQLAYEYLEDSDQIAEIGYKLPRKLALYHPPEYWEKLYEVYENARCIRDKTFFELCKRHPYNPTEQIEAYQKTVIKRRSGKSVRKSTTKKDDPIFKELRETHQAVPYYSDVLLRAAITNRSPNAAKKAAKELFSNNSVATQIWREYIHNPVKPQLSNSEFQKLVTTGATIDDVDNFLEKATYLERYCRQKGFSNENKNYMRRLLLTNKTKAYDLDTLAAEAQKASRISSLRSRTTRAVEQIGEPHKLQHWMYEKIVTYYDTEERLKTTLAVNQLLVDEIILVDHISCALEATLDEATLNAFCDKYGRYLVINPVLNSLNHSEIRTLSIASGADLFLYGHRLKKDTEIKGDDVTAILKKAKELIKEEAMTESADNHDNTPVTVEPQDAPQQERVEEEPVDEGREQDARNAFYNIKRMLGSNRRKIDEYNARLRKIKELDREGMILCCYVFGDKEYNIKPRPFEEAYETINRLLDYPRDKALKTIVAYAKGLAAFIEEEHS